MEAVVAGFGLIQILLLIAGVMAILTPFFVFRIRSESIKTNQKLNELISLMKIAQELPVNVSVSCGGKGIKRCPSCNAKNRLMDLNCIKFRAVTANVCSPGDAGQSQSEQKNTLVESIEESVLCEDEDCLGVLGSDGKCETCGRSPDEVKYGGGFNS